MRRGCQCLLLEDGWIWFRAIIFYWQEGAVMRQRVLGNKQVFAYFPVRNSITPVSRAIFLRRNVTKNGPLDFYICPWPEPFSSLIKRGLLKSIHPQLVTEKAACQTHQGQKQSECAVPSLPCWTNVLPFLLLVRKSGTSASGEFCIFVNSQLRLLSH